MKNSSAEAQEIIDLLDSKSIQVLNQICFRLKQSPKQYIEHLLRDIDSKRCYCDQEGIPYNEYRTRLFLTQINGIQSNLETLTPKY